MIDVFTGDSISFGAYLTDTQGSYVSEVQTELNVLDGFGSLVFSGSAYDVGNGSYTVTSLSTTGWNTGPLMETWNFQASVGTLTKISNNGFRIVGTTTMTPYVYADELPSYYENIVEFFDGNEDSQVMDAYSEVNSRLNGIGIKLPLPPNHDGFYDQCLRDLNAYEALYRIVSKRQASFNRTSNEKPWFHFFRDEADRTYKMINSKVYSLGRDYSEAQAGIGIATKTMGTSPIQMETNWRGAVGLGFTDSSFQRDWVVNMIGTGNTGTISEGTYLWSRDGGLTFTGTYITSIDWQELKDGVHVRFTRGTYRGGTDGLMSVGDTWEFQTFPRTQVQGKARSY